MKLLRKYIRELLEANEYGWEVSNRKNMKLDQEGMEKACRDEVESYLQKMSLMEGTVPLGQCYPYAIKMAQQATDAEFRDLSKFRVIHGRITDKWSGETASHAWVEKGDMIFDWQTSSTKPEGIDRAVYYDMYQPEIHSEYTAEETILKCIQTGQKGPW